MNTNQINPTNKHKENNRFETGIGPFTDKVLGSIINKLTGEDFKEILSDNIVDPITVIVGKKIRPYVYATILLYLIVVLLLIFIIFLLLKRKAKSN